MIRVPEQEDRGREGADHQHCHDQPRHHHRARRRGRLHGKQAGAPTRALGPLLLRIGKVAKALQPQAEPRSLPAACRLGLRQMRHADFALAGRRAQLQRLAVFGYWARGGQHRESPGRRIPDLNRDPRLAHQQLRFLLFQDRKAKRFALIGAVLFCAHGRGLNGSGRLPREL